MLCSAHHTDAFQLRHRDEATLSLSSLFSVHKRQQRQVCAEVSVCRGDDFTQPPLCCLQVRGTPTVGLHLLQLCSSCRFVQPPTTPPPFFFTTTRAARLLPLLPDSSLTPCIDLWLHRNNIFSAAGLCGEATKLLLRDLGLCVVFQQIKVNLCDKPVVNPPMDHCHLLNQS